LVHAEEIDRRALAWISAVCPNLRSLGLHNCEFIEPEVQNPNEEEIHEFQIADRMRRAEEER